MRQFLVLLLAGAAAGCSGAGANGPGTVAVQSDPSGASCTVQRGGTVLGVVQTPGSLAVSPGEKDLLVTCSKPGWQTASGTVKAIYKGIGFGQLLSGGAAAVVEDAVKQSDFRYDPNGATITLVRG